ncbi:glycosyltransferase [Stieleria sp. JC731]|uniref:glycosyltransferase n=1 Tax=Roseiconus sp. JC912 TaxID=3396307 RepID=UPI003A4C6637|nr:glycosyltransferase [Stieleria sp. JC731]
MERARVDDEGKPKSASTSRRVYLRKPDNQTVDGDVAVRMKIDLVITELNMGGAEKALTRLALGLQQRDYDVRVLSIGSEPDALHAGLVDQLRTRNINVEFGGFDSTSRLISAARWLGQKFHSRKPDLCQTFLFHANCLGGWTAKRSGVKRTIAGIRVAEDNRLRCFIESRALRNFDHVVCVSQAVQTFARRKLAIAEGQSSVIANGTELIDHSQIEPFDWTTLGFDNYCKVLLFAGRFHPQKGLELLQQQFAKLVDADPSIRLVLIGHGPLEAELAGWIASHAGDRARLLPFQKDLRPYIAACDLFVLPSHYEGMANVALEAMATGKAVVCSQIEGTAELLLNSPNAAGPKVQGDAANLDRATPQSFPKGDGDAMRVRILNLLRDDDLRARLGKANRQSVRENFTVERMVAKYDELYRSQLPDVL